MKKTWSIILKMIIAVAGAIAGVIGVHEKQAGFFPPVCVLFRKIENLINLVG